MKYYDIIESENLFDAVAYCSHQMILPNSEEGNDSEEETDLQHLSADQLVAQADLRIDIGTHITNSLEAECYDVENVKDL